MHAPPDCEVLIAGGGMVGAALACALGRAGLRVVVVEAVAAEEAPGRSTFDDRGLALSLCSERILRGVGVWAHLAPSATPIERVHVSDLGGWGFTRLTAAEAGLAALGHVALARELGRALVAARAGLSCVEWLAPARVVSAQPGEQGVTVGIDCDGQARTLHARLLVVADGTGSRLRGLLGVGAREHDYGQSAIVTSVAPERPHANTAYERFTPTGPLAFLPMAGNRCTVVWTVPHETAPALLQCQEREFLDGLLARFGHRLGRLRALGGRRAYPFSRLLADKVVGPRHVIVGNAAHTVHANGAQGLNLGLRDAAALAEAVVDAHRLGLDPGQPAVLERYAAGRAADVRRVSLWTHGLVQTFCNDLAPLRAGRRAGLLAVDLLPPLKRALVRQGTGLAAARTRLARGLPL